MKSIGLLGGLALGLAVLGGCNREELPHVDSTETLVETPARLALRDGKGGDLYWFGFDLRDSPQEDARQYLPFLDYLARETGLKFQLNFTPKNEQIVDRLGRGSVQFAAIGAVSYIEAREKYGAIILARGRNHQGLAQYRSKLVVAWESTLTGVTALRGKRVAFGSETSTQGHLIPRILLAEHGIALGNLADFQYTGSHLNCANEVVAGRADVCGMQDTMADDLATKRLVRILAVSDYFPSSGIAANQEVPPEVVARVTKALLQFAPTGRHKEPLHNWHHTEMPLGFIAAKPGDYKKLRAWMKTLKFGDNTEYPAHGGSMR